MRAPKFRPGTGSMLFCLWERHFEVFFLHVVEISWITQIVVIAIISLYICKRKSYEYISGHLVKLADNHLYLLTVSYLNLDRCAREFEKLYLLQK